MAENWRRKTYYEKRVLIDTQAILNTTFPDLIVCLSGDQVEMLRNLTQYLHRRSTFAEDYTTTGYNAPTNEDWDIISASVADLEEKLMGTMCEDLIAVLEGQAASIEAMMLCICQIKENTTRANAELPDLTGYVDETLVNYQAPSETYGTPTAPATDEAKCELAQAMYYYTFDMFTETLLPAANGTADSITSTIIAGSAFLGFATFIGVPVAVLSIIAAAVVAWAIDGSIANYTNWLYSARDDIVCILYNNYPDYAAASTAIKAWIDEQSTISFLDRQLTKTVLGSVWHMTWVSAEQQRAGTWDDRFVNGQCDDCEIIPTGCLSLLPCDAGDWTGTVACMGGYPRITGGTSYHTGASMVVPITGADLSLRWIPRGSAGGVGAISFGVVRVSDLVVFDLQHTVDRAFDVPVTETVALPSQVWGQAVYLWVKQEAWWGDMVYWCITE